MTSFCCLRFIFFCLILTWIFVVLLKHNKTEQLHVKTLKKLFVERDILFKVSLLSCFQEINVTIMI